MSVITPGASVEVYSRSSGKWAAGKVISVEVRLAQLAARAAFLVPERALFSFLCVSARALLAFFPSVTQGEEATVQYANPNGGPDMQKVAPPRASALHATTTRARARRRCVPPRARASALRAPRQHQASRCTTLCRGLVRRRALV